MTASAAMYPTGQSPIQSSHQGNLPVWPATLQGSYVPIILPPGFVPVSGLPPYQVVPVSPAASPSTQPTIGATTGSWTNRVFSLACYIFCGLLEGKYNGFTIHQCGVCQGPEYVLSAVGLPLRPVSIHFSLQLNLWTVIHLVHHFVASSLRRS
ncbi:hypothetical protein SASPL_150677 [Salvia splendens]|uniref:Uncharacterized protein n=1 Tax=Salvia splendens TaxID=180675 RepID=A0A8X8W6Z3_SALSN|nr:hypothetical protein SASPL_150677 [Salvia splendens]